MTAQHTQPYLLRWKAGTPLRLRPAVDARHQNGIPINRDHDLPAYSQHGRRLTDQHTMRAGLVLTWEEHLADLTAAHPDERILAFVGDGNRLANFGFVLWNEGMLFHLAEEPVYHRAYRGLIQWRDGSLSVEDFWFAQENGRAVVLRATAGGLEDVSEQAAFAASGQPLVRRGEPTDLSAIAEEWYDTRHLVRSIRLAVNGTSLYYPNAQLMQGLARKALVGSLHLKLEAEVDEHTVLPLNTAGWRAMVAERPHAACCAQRFLKEHGALPRQESLKRATGLLQAAAFTERLLTEGLRESGYQAIDLARPLQEGEYRFLNGHMEINLHKAVYPHNMFVRWADGTCGFVVFPGQSGRQGITLPAAQQFLTDELQVKDAILLDNGGDVRLWYRGREIVASSENRPQIRALLALAAPADAPLAFAALSVS